MQFSAAVQAAAGTCSGTVKMASFPFVIFSGNATTVLGHDNSNSTVLQCQTVGGTSGAQLFTAAGSNPTVTDSFTCTGVVEIN